MSTRRLFIYLFLVAVLGSGLGDGRAAAGERYWKSVRPACATLAGSPIKVLDIITTSEVCRGGFCYYTYKLIIQRPNGDDARGVAYLREFNQPIRLRYWVSVPGFTLADLLYNDIKVSQHIHPTNPRLIVLHIQEGQPIVKGSVPIRVGVVPYPMVGNLDFREVAKTYEFAKFLKNLNGWRRRKFLPDMLDAGTMTFEKMIQFYVNSCSEIINLEVWPVMPRIQGLKKAEADRQLAMRRLIPAPGPLVYTNDPRLDGTIQVQQYPPGYRLPAFNRVAYKMWKYRGRSPVIGSQMEEREVVGRYKWFNGGVTVIKGDHSMDHYRDGRNITNNGTWQVTDRARRRVQLRWNKGRWVDNMTLSADGRKLDGTNNAGTHVWGVK